MNSSESLPEDAEIDSISINNAKSVYSNDSINTLSNNTDTVQSDRISESDSAVIAASTTTSDDGDGDGDDEKKVSKKESKSKTLVVESSVHNLSTHA